MVLFPASGVGDDALAELRFGAVTPAKTLHIEGLLGFFTTPWAELLSSRTPGDCLPTHSADNPGILPIPGQGDSLDRLVGIGYLQLVQGSPLSFFLCLDLIKLDLRLLV